MSMRARDPQDYKQGEKSNVMGGEGLGMMGGKDKDQMNQMFDTRGKNTDSLQKNLMQALENNKKKYDKQLYSDWIVRVYQKCSYDCLKPPLQSDENPALLKDFEKKCATNCIRKYDRAYKLYNSTEDTIFNSYMETTDIDPEQFYAQINDVSMDQFKK